MSATLQGPLKKGAARSPAAAPGTGRIEENVGPLRCRACGHLITHASSRREVDGRHVHLRLNPSAFAFIFGCFSAAPGCALHGVPTSEATWFAGCRWQYAHCGRCLAHLGWGFTGALTFFALLLERLTEE